MNIKVYFKAERTEVSGGGKSNAVLERHMLPQPESHILMGEKDEIKQKSTTIKSQHMEQNQQRLNGPKLKIRE